LLKVNKNFLTYLAKFSKKLRSLANIISERDKTKLIELKYLQTSLDLLTTHYKLNLKGLIKRFIVLIKKK
jgi:hypothetical protein